MSKRKAAAPEKPTEAAVPRERRTSKWRTQTSDGSEALADLRQERFCRLISEGLLPARAYEAAGYAPGSANSGAPYRTLQSHHIVNRIRHIELETARARGEDAEATKKKVRSRLEEISRAAFFAGQFAVAKDCEIAIGKDVGMFRERVDHTFAWDGDPRKLTEAQLANLTSYLEAGLFGDDQAAIAANRQRALGPATEPGKTVDVTGEAVQ